MRSSTGRPVAMLSSLLLACCTSAAFADDEAGERTSGAFGGAEIIDAPPRFTRTVNAGESQHRLAGFRTELAEFSYRWWASSGRADVGIGLGAVNYVARPTAVVGFIGDGASPVLASGAVLTLGLRYRTSERSALFADASGVSGLHLDNGEAVVGKVGVEFKAAQSRWNIAYGGLGLRLAGDTRMTLRLRHGGLALYMRSSF